VDVDLEQQVLALVLLVQRAHGVAHPQRGDCAVRRGESGHDCVADGFHHGTRFGGDDLVQDPEMRLDDVECHQVADAFV
jgi:hypothetical protein